MPVKLLHFDTCTNVLNVMKQHFSKVNLKMNYFYFYFCIIFVRLLILMQLTTVSANQFSIKSHVQYDVHDLIVQL